MTKPKNKKGKDKGYKVLRRNGVEIKTGLSRSSIYLGMQKGTFPKPISLGPRAVGWLEDEIDEWVLSRIEDRDVS